MQVLVFSAASFLVIRMGGGVWEPRLFLAVPLVVCVFSYLWCVSVLIGVLTRSAVAAILLTVIAWMMIWGVDKVETVVLLMQTQAKQQFAAREPDIKNLEIQSKARHQLLAATTEPSSREVTYATGLDKRLQQAVDDRERDAKTLKNVNFGHTLIYRVKSALPKTRETNDLLDRVLFSKDKMRDLEENRAERRRNGPEWSAPEVVAEAGETLRSRPVSWIIGTSLMFEAVLLSWAAWVFCRRDY